MNTRAAIAGDGWSERELREFGGSPFDRIGNDWMLVSAGEVSDWNAMTASWGGLGVVWNACANPGQIESRSCTVRSRPGGQSPERTPR